MDDDRSGALGCGCALPIGLLLGLVAFALIGTLAGSPATASGQADDGVALALSEAYLNGALSDVRGGGDGSAWQLDVLPGNQVSVRGMVAASALGRSISLSVRLLLGVTVNDGRVEFALISAELPVDADATTAAGLVNPLLDAANAELETRLVSALGARWRVTGLSSSDEEILVYLQEERTS